MDRVGQPFSSGNWVVKEGSERDFIAAWTEFAQWTIENFTGVERAFLIQDTGNPRHFVSFGGWADTDAVTEWRSHPEFAAKLGKARALCDEFEARDYSLASAPPGRA
ncbi:MAG: putative quinol monooxygenase [Actinomycetota bacterium]